MGVHSLWKVLEPSSKAVRLESLSKRKLAIDASIWVYQFLKAVRDKNGASFAKSHIVGFFRRICKLIYFGILPVFVFDGGAPALKRQTILKRKERRQGNRDNAENTAKRLLALQLQRQQEGEKREKSPVKKVDDSQLKYLDEIDKPDNEKTQHFKSSDEYHLQPIEGFKHKKDDTRLVTDIDTSSLTQANNDELDGIDLNTIDPSSKEFDNLPLTTQYMVLSQLRLRSRLRMGYSKDQLENIFPNSIDFSKFQIQMVQKRNYFTQKLMGISGMDTDVDRKHEEIKRVAGERGKAYKISKNEGGWSLSLNDEDHGTSVNPIDLDKELKKEKRKEDNPLHINKDEDDDDDDIEWEDVLIENNTKKKVNYSIGSLPLPPKVNEDVESGTMRSFTFSPEKKKRAVKRPIDEDDNFEEDTLDQIEQIELMEAIENSKNELHKDLEMEKVLKSNINSEPIKHESEDEDDEEEEAMDLFEDIDIPTSLPQPKVQPKSTINPPNPIDSQFRSEMDHLLYLDKTSPSKAPLISKSLIKGLKVPSRSVSPPSTEPSSVPNTSVTEPVIKESNSAKNKTPSWFNNDNSLGLSMKNSSLLTLKPKNKEQIDGLVPWFEAKEIIENNEDDDGIKHSDDVDVDDDDLQIIEPEPVKQVISLDDPEPEPVQQVVSLDDDVEVLENKPVETVREVVKNKKSDDVSDDRSVDAETRQEASNGIKETKAQREDINDNDETEFQQKDSTNNESKPAEADTEETQKQEIPIMDYEFFESDEEELENQLAEEEKEHEQFTKDLNPNIIKNTFVDTISESKLRQKYNNEQRDSDEVTMEMIRDVQELLSYFGIPYITAPMEAEAQCGELLQLKLVDGIITDDSDVFLFGGDKVYKNMFHEKHYVEFYNGANLEQELGLDRQKLINLAHLLGSDYTEGLKGIGPVNAMEILAHFDGDLNKFRDWFIDGQFDLTKQSKEESFLKNLRKKLVKNNIVLDKTFPDKNIDMAYLQPEVDSDKTGFKWGKPDLDRIREYLMARVGWSKDRVDEVLLPLIRHLNKKEREGAQSTLNEFYEPTDYKVKQLSKNKRISEASGRIKRRKK